MGAEVAVTCDGSIPETRKAETASAEPALHPEDAELDGLKIRLEAMEKEFKETHEVHELTIMTWDTWHGTITGIPYEEHNLSSSLIWNCPLPGFRRRLDPNVPGNILLYPAPPCTVSIMTATPNNSPQCFQYGVPHTVVHSGSYAVSARPPLRYYNAVFGAWTPDASNGP